MRILKTDIDVQNEKDNSNRLYYRRSKALEQGLKCPVCDHYHWSFHANEDKNDCCFLFVCESCGAQWESDHFDINYTAIESLEHEARQRAESKGMEISISGLIRYWFLKQIAFSKIKKEMNGLEIGYDPSVDYKKKSESEG